MKLNEKRQLQKHCYAEKLQLNAEKEKKSIGSNNDDAKKAKREKVVN